MAKSLKSLGVGDQKSIPGPIPIPVYPSQVLIRLYRDTSDMLDNSTQRHGRLKKTIVSMPPDTEEMEESYNEELRRWVTDAHNELLELSFNQKVGIIARTSLERMTILCRGRDILSGYEHTGTDYVKTVILEFESDGRLMKARLPPPPKAQLPGKALPPIPSTKKKFSLLPSLHNALSSRRSVPETARCTSTPFLDLDEKQDNLMSKCMTERQKSSPNYIKRNVDVITKEVRKRWNRKSDREKRYESQEEKVAEREECEETEPKKKDHDSPYDEYVFNVLFVFSQFVRAWKWDTTTTVLSLPLDLKKAIVTKECHIVQGRFHIIRREGKVMRMPKLPHVNKNVVRAGRMKNL